MTATHFTALSFEVVERGVTIIHGEIAPYSRPKRFPFTLAGARQAMEACRAAFFGDAGQIAPRSIGVVYVLHDERRIVAGNGLPIEITADDLDKSQDREFGPRTKTAALERLGNLMMEHVGAGHVAPH